MQYYFTFSQLCWPCIYVTTKYENNPVAQQDEVRKLKCTFRRVEVVEAESRNLEVLFILGHNIYSSAIMYFIWCEAAARAKCSCILECICPSPSAGFHPRHSNDSNLRRLRNHPLPRQNLASTRPRKEYTGWSICSDSWVALSEIWDIPPSCFGSSSGPPVGEQSKSKSRQPII